MPIEYVNRQIEESSTPATGQEVLCMGRHAG